MFDELMEHLREQVMGAHFRAMAQGMQNLSPEELARFRDMLAELNDMIERRDARRARTTSTGSCSATATSSPGPEDAGRAAGAHGPADGGDEPLMASLSPEQRAELQALAEQVMQDMDLAFEVGPAGREPRRRDAGHALGRAGDGRRWWRPAGAVGDRRRAGAPARLRGPRALHDRRLRRRGAGGRGRGRGPPHARRAGRAGPPAAEGDRARAGAGRARARANTAGSR